MELTLHKQIRENAPLRKSFDALAQKTFGISFEGLFVLSGKENIFTGSRVLFPLLSHA
jgi:hypothetical protein